MSFKTILVLLDNSEDSTARLDVACNLAGTHGAHLNALAVSQQISTYIAADIHAGAAMVDVGQIEEARKQAQSVATAAKQKIDDASILGEARWISHEAYGLREAVGMHGRHADLIIAGQPADGFNRDLRETAIEGALFSSGRPVLMVPTRWDKAVKASHVVVAWDASQQSARALGAAAPFLDRASNTTIVIVDPKPGHDALGPDPGVDISAVVTRHCSKVLLDRIPSAGASVAEAVLARAGGTASDLIVMGGYGHSVLRESVFGGVSRDMIEKATVPLLLSH